MGCHGIHSKRPQGVHDPNLRVPGGYGDSIALSGLHTGARRTRRRVGGGNFRVASSSRGRGRTLPRVFSPATGHPRDPREKLRRLLRDRFDHADLVTGYHSRRGGNRTWLRYGTHNVLSRGLPDALIWLLELT